MWGAEWLNMLGFSVATTISQFDGFFPYLALVVV